MTSSFLRGGCAALALIAATPALAQAPSNADLADLLSELYREKGDTERVLHYAAVARQQRYIDQARAGKEM